MAKKKSKKKEPLVRKLIQPSKPEIDRLAMMVGERKNVYEAERNSDYTTRWEKGLKYFEQRTPPRKFKWQSNAFIPIVYRDTQTIMCRIEELLLNPIPMLRYVGNPNDNEQKYHAYRMRRGKGYLAATDSLWEGGIYGTGWTKVICNSEPQRIYTRERKITPGKDIIKRASGIESEEYEEKQQIITRNIGPTPYYVPNWNVFCSANETGDIDEADVLEVVPVSLMYLVGQSRNVSINPHNYMFGRYDNVEKIVALAETLQSSRSTDMGETLGKQGLDPQYAIRDLRKEGIIIKPKFNITLIIFQGDFRHGGKFYKNGEITIAELSAKKQRHYVTLRVLPCRRSDGRKDYIRCVYERTPGRLYGRSIPDSLFRLQENVNDMVRLIFDRDKISLLSPTAYDVDRVDDPKLLQIRMGGLMPVSGPPSEIIQSLKFDPSQPGAWKIVELLSGWAMEASGAKEPLGGEAQAANRTATGITRMLAAAEQRIKSTARKMAEEYISDLGEAMHTSLKDHFEEIKDQEKGSITFNFVNNKGQIDQVELKREDISNNVDVYAPHIFERVDKQQTAQQILQILQYVAGLIGEENLLELCRTVWEYLELPNAEKLFAPNPQSMPIELVNQILMGMSPQIQAEFSRRLNELAAQQGQGGGQGKGKQAAKAQPAQNQGTAQTAVTPTGPNTGRTS